MNVPANRPEDGEPRGDEPEDGEPRGDKWSTIRYAIRKWDTTIRLSVVLLVLSTPISLIVLHLSGWLGHR